VLSFGEKYYVENLLFSCTAFTYDKATTVCEVFIIGPFSYNIFLSDEARSDEFYVRENLYG